MSIFKYLKYINLKKWKYYLIFLFMDLEDYLSYIFVGYL